MLGKLPTSECQTAVSIGCPLLVCEFATMCAVSESGNKALVASGKVGIDCILAASSQILMCMPDFTGGPMCKYVGVSAMLPVIACVGVAEETNF